MGNNTIEPISIYLWCKEINEIKLNTLCMGLFDCFKFPNGVMFMFVVCINQIQFYDDKTLHELHQ